MQVGTWAEVVSGRYAAATAMFSLGIGLHAFNAFIASTTMPSAAVELDSVALLSWATSAYLVASIVGGAAAATLKGRFGAQSVMLGASVIFVVGSFAFGLAQGAWQIVLGRIAQGAGEGVVMACCYMLIPEVFSKTLVPRIFALESVVWVVGALGGPLLAGAMAEFVSWRAAAMMSVPLSLVFAALVPLCTPRRNGAPGAGSALPATQLGLVAIGVFLVSASGATSNVALAAGAALAGLGALGVCVVADGPGGARLLPRSGFSMSDPVGAGLLLVLLLTIVEAPPSAYVAFLGRSIWGLGPTQAGLLGATLAISWSVVAIVAAHLPRLPAAAHITAAPLLLALGLGLLALALRSDALWLAILGQATIGAGFGFSWARLCEQVMSVAPAEERDFAMGALPTIQSAGLSIGIAMTGTSAAWMGLRAEQSPADAAAIVAPIFALAAGVAALSTLVARRVA